VTDEEFQDFSNYTKALAKRVIQKIDMRILAIIFATYNPNFMDKTILSSAAVSVLQKTITWLESNILRRDQSLI
jgi:hypothetical protein